MILKKLFGVLTSEIHDCIRFYKIKDIQEFSFLAYLIKLHHNWSKADLAPCPS